MSTELGHGSPIADAGPEVVVRDTRSPAPPPPVPSTRTVRGFGAVVPLATVAVSAVGLLAPVVWLLAHRDDRAGLDHTAGTWLALTEWARHGLLMPPLHAEGFYAGTRYLPLPIEVQALLADALGGPLRAGRVVSAGGTVLAALLLLVAARRFGGSARVGALAAAAFLSTPIAVGQLTSVRNDALPAVASVAGLLLLLPREGRPLARRHLVLAGAVLAFAPLWKVSEVWAPAAAVLALVLPSAGAGRLRRLGLLTAGAAAVTVPVTTWMVVATDGRAVSQLRVLLFSGEDPVTGWGQWLPRLLDRGLPAAGLLLVPALLGLAEAVRRRPPDVLALAVLCCVPVTLFVYTDRGVEANHLVDLLLLGSVAALRAWIRSDHAEVALVVVASVMIVSAWLQPLRAVSGGASYPFWTPTQAADDQRPVLSEDPAVPLASGRLPVVLDAFALRRQAKRDPALQAGVVQRIERHEFASVVLLADAAYLDPTWYQRMSFGPAITDAICRSYRSTGLAAAGRYEVLVPADGPVTAATQADTVCHPQVRHAG